MITPKQKWITLFMSLTTLVESDMYKLYPDLQGIIQTNDSLQPVIVGDMSVLKFDIHHLVIKTPEEEFVYILWDTISRVLIKRG